MNIAFDPWIPVTAPDGASGRISLHDALTHGEDYADLAVRPHERVALMRLLLCVSHASLKGPKDFDEWETVPKLLPEAADSYLKTWKDSFELFHPEKPWLQVAGLNVCASPMGQSQKDPEGSWQPLTKLSLTRASGNNSTLFDHSASSSDYETFTDPEIALNLLTFQNYFIAGGKAPSRMWGSIEMKNPPNPKGGPCAGKSIIYSFGRRSNILSTIHINLNHFEDIGFIYDNNSSLIGKPIWELPIDMPFNENSINNATKTHLGRLVPQTRILKN
jgi:CRISPR system Cascade subunit CasA